MALRSEVSASNFENLPMCVTSVQHAYWSTCVSITCWVMLMCSSACLGTSQHILVYMSYASRCILLCSGLLGPPATS